MAEWPKGMVLCVKCGAVTEFLPPRDPWMGCEGDITSKHGPTEETAVIPADLARELYDLLGYATMKLAECRSGVPRENFARLRDVLARYEQIAHLEEGR